MTEIVLTCACTPAACTYMASGQTQRVVLLWLEYWFEGGLEEGDDI